MSAVTDFLPGSECPCGCGSRTRFCPTCSRDLPVSAFWKAARRPHGLRGQCKECERAGFRGWRNGSEHRKAYERQWKSNHPEVSRRAGKKWRDANPDMEKERASRNYDRGTSADRVALRRARLRGVPTESIDRSAIYERDGGRCYLCRRAVSPARFELDHMLPVSAGGAHLASNLAVTHPKCNRRKGAKIIPVQERLVAS